MLIDLSRALSGYVAQVLEQSWSVWVLVGIAGQLLFSARFIIQWLASERAGRSIVPVAFWFVSIGAAGLVLAYGLYRRDPVIILGQSLGMPVYVRNLMLIHRERRERLRRDDEAERAA